MTADEHITCATELLERVDEVTGSPRALTGLSQAHSLLALALLAQESMGVEDDG